MTFTAAYSMRYLLLGFGFLLLAMVCPARGESNTTRLAPAPAWVLSLESPASVSLTAAKTDPGVIWLLADNQINVETKEYYSRQCYQVTSQEGVQHWAQIAFNYDPDYESLDFHFITVRRDGAMTDRLALDKIKTLQQERDLDRFQYNGRLTALVLLEDIRVGDVIDYAVTYRGRNPIYDDHYHDEFVSRWTFPMTKERIRVIASTKRTLYYKELHGSTLTHTVANANGLTEHTWTAQDLSPINLEDQLPAWFSPFPTLQITDYPDWSAVVQWARPLYKLPDVLPESLRNEATRLTAKKTSDEDRLLALLDFVQQDVRYLGIELGPNSHRPSPPDRVLERRYGDCKDKTLLLCALLHHVGIEATPALTHSYREQTLQEWLPSPDAFNHVIARITLRGRTYWVDPTLGEQGGRIESRYVPDYGLALPIAADVKRLHPVTIPPGAQTAIDVEETYLIKELGQSVDLSVKTIYRGGDADAWRSFIKTKDKAEFAKDVLNYRLRFSPTMEMRKPPEWTHDPILNQLTLKNEFTIKELWQKAESGGLSAEFSPLTFRGYIQTPESSHRSMPLRIVHPLKIDYRAAIELPEHWPIKDTSWRDTNEFFSATSEVRSKGKTVSLHYSFTTTADHVSPENMPAYLDALKRFRDQLGYVLTYHPEPAKGAGGFRWNWELIGSVLASLTVFTGIAWKIVTSQKPRAIGASSNKPDIAGIGGWLILVSLGVIVRPITHGLAAYRTLKPYLDRQVWDRVLASSVVTSENGFRSLVIGETIARTSLFILALLALVLFYQRRRLFRNVFIVLLLAEVVYLALDAATTWAVTTLHTEANAQALSMVGLIGVALIWIPYMLTSRRVRATFVD